VYQGNKIYVFGISGGIKCMITASNDDSHNGTAGGKPGDRVNNTIVLTRLLRSNNHQIRIYAFIYLAIVKIHVNKAA